MHISLKSFLIPALCVSCLLLSLQGTGVPCESDQSGADGNQYVLSKTHEILLDRSHLTVSDSDTGAPAGLQPPVSDGKDFSEKWLAERVYSLQNNEYIGAEREVVVAILDTGIDSGHEDLVGSVIDGVNLTESSEVGDVHGHGTHVAGIVSANAGNGLGIDGVAPDCRLLNVKVANDKGRCRASVLAEGIRWAVEHGADIINISIEIKDYSSLLEQAVDYAWEQGVLVIAAAGNDGSDIMVYPAGLDNCIGVTALQNELGLAPLANYGEWVELAAPGYQVYSTLPGDEYGYKYGTSFSAAYASGLAARLSVFVEDSNDDGRVNDEIRAQLLSLCGYSSGD
jgi:thermitase